MLYYFLGRVQSLVRSPPAPVMERDAGVGGSSEDGEQMKARIMAVLSASAFPLSPLQLSLYLGESLSRVRYHLVMLSVDGTVKVVRAEPENGVGIPFYAATDSMS
jgi:hypothetical protein